MKRVVKLLPLLSLFALTSCGKQTISYVLVSPSGNDTAIIEINHAKVNAKQVNDLVMEKEKSCEQTLFINDVNQTKKYCEMEMAGDEFCGNGARAAMYYLYDKYGWSQATLQYKDYPFTMDGKILTGDIAQITAKQTDLVVKTEEVIAHPGVTKVTMSGITHFVAFEDSDIWDLRNSEEATENLIKTEFLTDQDKSVGVMYATDNQSLFTLQPYVYVKDVDTMFYETACGSGTIATAYVLKQSRPAVQSFLIKQPSNKTLTVDFVDSKLSLSGVASIVNKGTLSL